ncbi:MAG: phosphoribosylaminoimidazolesuccinocarboxamide synthase [Bryobacteraceae bacterium]|nr:phosphoribosylaminoimidazolesuccinocarboxamide synthase [Bryobacteraceae bacterium]
MADGEVLMLESHLPGLTQIARGKVRDIYQTGPDLLLVTTDRISAFDYILPVGIPRKGEVLNRLSLFWFDFLRSVIANHVITADASEYPPELAPFREELQGRSVLVRKASMIPVECVARGYISGSGWKEYLAQGAICGIRLPAGLRESDRLPQPIFTPATKAETGHDENVSFDRIASSIGSDLAARLRDLTLEIYRRASEYAAARGILIADTKFEFGFVDEQLILADEVLTPDSSRFWPAEEWKPGGPQPSYDKQFVRDYLEKIQWNKQPPAPVLSPEVVSRTSEKYMEAYRLLTGASL